MGSEILLARVYDNVARSANKTNKPKISAAVLFEFFFIMLIPHLVEFFSTL
jgi:hypothetical protein